jgi:RNA polymerase sigma factor (sigma-70 family)
VTGAATAADEHASRVASEPTAAIDAFTELFKVFYPRVVRAMALAGASPSDAEDLAQEAFARTLPRWRQVRAGTNPPGYVFTTAFHLLRRRGLLPTSALDETATPGIDDAVAARVDWERALALMPPRRRACVLLCWVLEVPTAEAAGALGIAPGTVRKQLDLARRQSGLTASDDIDGDEPDAHGPGARQGRG